MPPPINGNMIYSSDLLIVYKSYELLKFMGHNIMC